MITAFAHEGHGGSRARRRPAAAGTTPLALFLLGAILLGGAGQVKAQWLTQTLVIKPGWNAVYLHVDASYETLDQLVGYVPDNPIVEIWLWEPAVTPSQILPFQTQPAAGSQWASWVRADYGPAGTLSRLIPNAAYLVHSTAASNFTWQVKGKPAAPSYAWTSTGLNFIGFPTPPNNAPLFSAFLAPAPALAGGVQLSSDGQRAPGIYRYGGGSLGTNNPSKLIPWFWGTTSVTRGQAFWVDAGPALNNSYFGPFQVVLTSSSGLDFGDSAGQSSFTLRNVTSSLLVVSVGLVASESAPTNQAAIAGVPPVLLRGPLRTNLSYAAVSLGLGSSQSYTLAPQGQPGSELTVVLGINRYQMTRNPGDLYAGILRFTDSLNLSQVEVPISAQVTSFAGLWVGNASLNQVANYLKLYARDTNSNPIIGDPAVGSYVVTNVDTSLGPVAKGAAFPMRLIVHSDGTNAVLLQRVFYGQDVHSNLVVATSEKALDRAHFDTARRISSVSFPWSGANTVWPFSGRLAPGGSLTQTIAVGYDDQTTNPFLHTYHPDHDNLDATFKTQLGRGSESYDVQRQITLTISNNGDDFVSLTRTGQSFAGTYQEAVTLVGLNGSARTFQATGYFALNRISPIATLTRP